MIKKNKIYRLNRIIFILLLSYLFLFASESQLHFNQITVEDGLSHGAVYDIIQDDHGFMWFATKDGLTYYDGYSFEVYRNIINDSTSLPHNFVTELECDSAGNIWVGTDGGGLAKFDPHKKTFTHFDFRKYANHNANFSIINDIHISRDGKIWAGTTGGSLYYFDPNTEQFEFFPNLFENISISSLHILSTYEDNEGNIWAGSLNNGTVKLNPETNETTHYLFEEYKTGYGIETVTSFAEDKNNNLWIGTYDGLIKYDKKDDSFKRFSVYSQIGTDLPFENISDIIEFQDEFLWLTTNGGGVLRFHLPTEKFESFISSSTDKYSISYNTTKTIFKDKDENIWIGTNGKGVNVLFAYSKNFQTIGEKKDKAFDLGFSSVRTILPWGTDQFWVGGYGGLVLFHKAKGIVYTAPYLGKRTKVELSTPSLINNIIYTTELDPLEPQNVIWIGSEGGGLIRLDYADQSFTNFIDYPTIPEEHRVGSQIYEVAAGPDKNIWVGGNRGLIRINPTDFSKKFFNHDPDDNTSIFEGSVISIYFDKSNSGWIGSSNSGFAIMDLETQEFKIYKRNTTKKDWLRSNTIFSFLEDSDSRFWLATGRGLHRFYRDSEKFVIYNIEEGLPSSIVYSILEDEDGYFWLSTNNGLSRFDPVEETFVNYTYSDGLQGNEFNSSAYNKDNSGTLFFGGTRGLTYFDPAEIEINPVPPEIVFTKITIVSDEIKTIDHPADIDKIELHHDDDVVTFEFAALNYQSPQLNQYKYLVEGINDNWVNLENQRTITFTDLPSGTYNLRVKASNNDGVWNEEGVSLELVVNPPFWASLWFIFLVNVIVIGILILIYRYRVNAIKNQRAVLEELVKERTKELEKSRVELKNANDAKDKLFSIIAHDMKNPFNTLLGYSEMLTEDFDELTEEEKKSAINGMADASKEAFNLLENLLDWSRIQMERIPFSQEKVDVTELIEENTQLFQMAVSEKNISINKNYSEDNNAFVDRHMINTVIRNLLANSIKFTKEGGEITLATERKDSQLLVSIKDDGIGMTKETIDGILSQSTIKSSDGTSGEKGTGLGLILCKEFISKNNGELKIESGPGKGSIFSFTLPISK